MSTVLAASRLRTELRERGVRFRNTRPDVVSAGWGSLTPTENLVSELAAAGLSNAAIAERLRISRRTVESHLLRTYRKLGVSSRIELLHLKAEPPR